MPRVNSVRDVTLAGAVLAVELEVAVLRDLLTPEFRAIWSAGDETHEAGTAKLRTGSLPDLAMEYQLFFRTDVIKALKPESSPDHVQVWQTLVRVGLKPNPAQSGTLVTSNAAQGVTATAKLVQTAGGRLRVHIDFAFAADEPLGLLALARGLQSLPHPDEPMPLRRLIVVQGVRGGAPSKPMEYFEGAPL